MFPKKSKRLVKSNTRFSITEMKNFLEKLRDFFFSIAIYGYVAIKFFVFIFLPRTCKCMIGGLLRIRKRKKIKEVCGGNVEMQRKERNLVGKVKSIHRECVFALREKRMIPLSENVRHTGHSLLALSWIYYELSLQVCSQLLHPDCIEYH